MAATDITGPPSVSELEQLSRAYKAQSIQEGDLSESLGHQDLVQAADHNARRSRLHRRTAEILLTYAREKEALAAQPHPAEASE